MIKRFVFTLLGIFLCLLFVTGCKKPLDEMCFDVVSETREGFYFARNNNLSVTFTKGYRETDYQMNGIHTEMVSYGVLVVNFYKKDFKDIPKFVITIDNRTFTGLLEYNPFNGTFCYDIEENIENIENIDVLLPNSGDKLNLICVSNMWGINSQTAIEISCALFEEKLNKYVVSGKIEGEFFQKLISLNRNSAEDIYWHICFFAKNGEILTCTIDVVTGKIVAM